MKCIIFNYIKLPFISLILYCKLQVCLYKVHQKYTFNTIKPNIFFLGGGGGGGSIGLSLVVYESQ